MKPIVVLGSLLVLVCVAGLSFANEAAEKKTPKKALQELNDLTGGTGEVRQGIPGQEGGQEEVRIGSVQREIYVSRET